MASIPMKGGAPLLLQREGSVAVRDRLIVLVLLIALLHAIVILGLTFSDPGAMGGAQSPQLDVLLVTDEAPAAQANERAAYLAQRTQLGNGNLKGPAPIASPASRAAIARLRSAQAGNDRQPGQQRPGHRSPGLRRA